MIESLEGISNIFGKKHVEWRAICLLYQDESNEILCCEMVPQYARLFLNSECMQPVVIIDGIFIKIRNDIRTIISDEGKGLKGAIMKVFPHANHQLCAWHIA